MIKKSLIVASLVLAATSAMAENTFIGLDLGKSKGTATVSYQGYSETSSGDKTSSISLKAGKQYSDHRIFAKYTDVNEEYGTSAALTAHYDKFLRTNGVVKPYIGGAIGYVSYESDDNTVDLSGLTYGATLGVVADITKEISFEIGYDYMLTSASDTLDNGVKVELDKYDNFHIGLNVKF
jgi:opacity protein-like surface antigen